MILDLEKLKKYFEIIVNIRIIYKNSEKNINLSKNHHSSFKTCEDKDFTSKNYHQKLKMPL